MVPMLLLLLLAWLEGGQCAHKNMDTMTAVPEVDWFVPGNHRDEIRSHIASWTGQCIFFCGGHFIGWDGVSLPSIIEFTLDPRISFAKVTCHLKSFVRGMMSQGPCRRTNASRP
jgi:hypothetical protein